MEIPPPAQLLDLTGRTAVVTGAGRGLGAAIARRLAQAGAAVAVNYRRDAAGAEAVAGQIRAAGGRALAVGADVAVGAEAARLVARTVGAFGRLDVVVNNAGIYPLAPLVEMSEEDFDRVVDDNLRSVFLVTREAARQMIAQGEGGAIVNVASIEGEAPALLHSHYNAAKAGVLMHTRAAALELGAHGIRVNSVAPGLIWRPGLEEDWPDGVARWLAAAPLGRLGMPEDVADACLFLAAAASRWVTGANLRVDGGVMARPAF